MTSTRYHLTKYIILMAATSLCATNIANAVEKGKFYASGSYGVGFADKFDYNDEDLDVKKPSNASVFSLAVGYGVSDNIRAELSCNGFYGMQYKFKKFLDTVDDNGEDTKTHVDLKEKNTVYAMFASAYYDVNHFGQIKPYVGAGVGVAHVQSKENNLQEVYMVQGGEEALTKTAEDTFKGSVSKTQFAWQVGAGVNYALNNKVELNLVNYRYTDLGKSAVMEGSIHDNSIKIRVHSISAGLTYKF